MWVVRKGQRREHSFACFLGTWRGQVMRREMDIGNNEGKQTYGCITPQYKLIQYMDKSYRRKHTSRLLWGSCVDHAV